MLAAFVGVPMSADGKVGEAQEEKQHPSRNTGSTRANERR
jgi:hypothetical protein